MRTPEEIKQGLRHCAGDGCEGCSYESVCYGTDGIAHMPGDALKYIMQLEAAHRTEYCEAADYDCVELGKARKRIAALEAELIATRTQLAKDGGLCRICQAQWAQDCLGDCLGCDNVDCCCKRCIDTDGKEGFEWDGGANDDV